MQKFVPAQYNLGLLFFHGKTINKKNIKEAQKCRKRKGGV